MADGTQEKSADEPLASIEIKEVSESRTDDESKTPIRPDRKRFREGYSPMSDPTTCHMRNQTLVEATKSSAIFEIMPEMGDRIKTISWKTAKKQGS